MKRFILSKSMLCLFLLGMVCNVALAQTVVGVLGNPTTTLTDGNYVLVAMSDKGTGPVYYDANAYDAKAGVYKCFRYEAGKTLGVGNAALSKYVWTIDETTVDGVQHITVTNYDDNTKAFPADGAHNQNFTGTGVASLRTEVKTIGGTNYIALTLDNASIGYIHANKPDGNPCLSYWESYGDAGSCIKFTFYPVVDEEIENVVKVYIPGDRVTTLEAGKKYFIYDTAINGNQDRTGFLFDNGSGMGHTKKKPFGDNILKTTNEAYWWEVVATESAGQYYIKAADGGYVNASGKTDNASGQILNIIPWPESSKKGDANSENTDGTTTANANIGSDVFTIYNGNTCWNGETGSFTTWSNCHPYAFYEIKEAEVTLGDEFPKPGKTYYIYCDNDTRQYFYNDGGTLKVSEKRTEWSNEYLFTCTFDGQYFQFKNLKGKYLKHHGLQDAAYNFELATYLDGVNLKTPGGKYFVMNTNGDFSQADRGDYNPADTDYSTVYKFEEYKFPKDGETYYIYSDTYYNGEYVNRYMYAEGSNLKLNTSLSINDAYKWTCTVTNDGYVQFQNGAGKYLKHRGVQDTPYNFTLNKSNANHAIAATLYSVAANRYFVVNNDGTGFNQADKTYNQTTEDYSTDFVFMPTTDVKVLTVQGLTYTDAKATWNGETKALPASWVITPQTVITDATLSVTGDENFTFIGLYDGATALGETTEIENLETNLTLTAKLTPSFFSATTAENDLVPVRIRNVRNGEYTLRLNASDNYTGKAVNSGKTAYGENEIWYLVGTEESFKIYNRVAGTGLHMVLAGTGGGSAASMNTTATNADFCLVAQSNGYAICPKANTGQSFNMHGGAGNDIKLFGAGDGGSVWVIEKMDINNPLTLNVEVDQVWESSPRVAELTLTIGGIAGQTRILGNVEGQPLYIPLGATYEVSSMTYRGYTYKGCDDNDGVLTVSYTANDERTLYYTPSTTGKPYRIPAIATAPNGHIFAIADHRPCGNDIGYGEVDIMCRISKDNGATWSNEFFIADGQGGDSNHMTTGYGDAAVVADRESNKLLVMMVCGRTVCHNGRWDKSKIGDAYATAVNRVARIYLTYNETTGEWEKSEIVEMTDHMYSIFLDGDNPTVPSMFIGSGKICQSRVVKKGEYYRLYCAIWTNNGGNRVIYSDDFGGTWNVLGTINDRPASGGDEPKCEELPDGSVILSSRVSGGRFFNIFTFNNDGEYTTGSWGQVAKSTTAYDGSANGTNGEIYKVKAIRKEDGQICDVMLQSIPAGPGRSNVKVYYKEMEYNADGTNKYTPATFAEGWQVGKHVSFTDACYSTMILQADGRIGFLLEEVPGGYCIVYIPYTLEDLTADKYSLSSAECATLVEEVNGVLNFIGESLGKYTVAAENNELLETARTAMENVETVTLSDLNSYKNLLDGATLNMPQPGQYFRVAYDYGGSVGKLYMQGINSGTKSVLFTGEIGNSSVWVYSNGTLTSYYDGRNLCETGSHHGLSDTETTVTFSESPRAKGKYNIQCERYIHAVENGENHYADHCLNDENHATHDLILEEAEVAVEKVYIGDWEIGTFYANGAMAIPEGVSAYVATAEPVMEGETGVITLTKIQTGVVPAKTGVIITGKAGYYDFTSVTSDASVGENFMCGYAGPETMKKVTLTNDASSSYYILTVIDQNIGPGFYKKAYDFNVYKNKAYLKLPITVAASLRFRFNNNDGTTDIIEVPTEALNGYGEIYDLSGRRVEKAGKGVYIVNGKKVIF